MPELRRVIYNLELQQNFRVCPKCDHHFMQSARERIDMLCDDDILPPTIGDVNMAEPKAMIGFSGPRAIKETTHQDLRPDFQTREFLEGHSLIDVILHRKKMTGRFSIRPSSVS